MPGHGTTTASHHYSNTDAGLSIGTYYYRLKQVDHNGAGEFSKVKSVVLMAPSAYLLKQNHPNPFNAATMIRYQLHGAGAYPVKLFIYN